MDKIQLIIKIKSLRDKLELTSSDIEEIFLSVADSETLKEVLELMKVYGSEWTSK